MKPAKNLAGFIDNSSVKFAYSIVYQCDTAMPAQKLPNC